MNKKKKRKNPVFQLKGSQIPTLNKMLIEVLIALLCYLFISQYSDDFN